METRMVMKSGMIRWGGLWALLCLAMGVAAQDVFYVRPDGAGDGSSWESAAKNIQDALDRSGAGDTVKVGSGEYLLTTELEISPGVVLSGGWMGAGFRAQIPAEATVLRSSGTHRVAVVDGEIEGVTVIGGVANGLDGGGLYVYSTGKVKNCIVKENVAKPYAPKVGDLLLMNGTFYSVGNTPVPAPVIATARGVVFWLNPDLTAPAGQRGWICALPDDSPLDGKGADFTKKWWNSGPYAQVNEAYTTLEEALADTAGWAHTQSMKDDPKFGAAAYCLDYYTLPDQSDRGKWYLPALGQLKFWYAEIATLQNTHKKLGLEGMNFFVEGNCYSSTESGQSGHELWILDIEPGFITSPRPRVGEICLLSYTSGGVTIPVTSF